MRKISKSVRLNEAQQEGGDSGKIDFARRDGSIRGVILTKEAVNTDRIFGLSRPEEDFSL